MYFNQRGDKCDEIARGQLSKITETACLSGWEFEADKSRYSVYVTRHWNLMNSYLMFWIGCLRGARLSPVYTSPAWTAIHGGLVFRNDPRGNVLEPYSIPTTNACKVDTSNRNHLKEAGGLRQKKYPLIWIHYEHPLLAFLGDLKWNRVHSRSHPPSSAMIREWSAVIREDRGEPPETCLIFHGGLKWTVFIRHSPCTDRQHPW